MSIVHPSAVVDANAQLDGDVTVGPMTVIGPGVRIGAGTVIIGQAWIEGPTTIGRGNRILPGVRLGFEPQSLSYDPSTPGQGLEIGDENVFREGFTAHRAMTDEGPTRIGSHNFFMSNSHVGHDTMLGDHCIIASGVVIGGHVRVADRVNIGGNSAIHQFVRIGRGAMLAGGAGSSLDVPPWFMLTGVNICGSLNLVGMRRSGMDRRDIDHVKWIYRRVSGGGTRAQVLDALRQRSEVPIVSEYIAWFEAAKRGWCTARGKAMRGVR